MVICLSSIAQAPQMFRYQAIARDATGATLADQPVGFQMRIIQGSPGGTAVYVETHSITTNEHGLANLTVGTGSVVAGAFSTIDWGADSYYLEVNMDATGGTSYTTMGTSQLISVPYALYAETAGSGGGGGGGNTVLNGASDPAAGDGSDGDFYINTTTNEIFGPKTGGVWGAGTSMVGPAGTDGADGAAGDPGVTGQAVTEVYGSAQIVATYLLPYTVIPGLTQSVTVPADCYVVVSTDGGIQCASAGTNFAVVDIGIHVDGVVSAQGGQRRIVASNTTAVGQMIANWSMTKTYTLAPGVHTIDVRVTDVGTGSADANVSSGSSPQLQGTLTVQIIKF